MNTILTDRRFPQFWLAELGRSNGWVPLIEDFDGVPGLFFTRESDAIEVQFYADNTIRQAAFNTVSLPKEIVSDLVRNLLG